VIALAIEKSGIPVVQITAVPSIAQWIGVKRVLRGKSITNPLGDNRLTREQEKSLRREHVLRALALLQMEVKPNQDSSLSGREEV